MKVIRRIAIGATLALVMTIGGTTRAENTEDKAIKAIESLGGKVYRDSQTKLVFAVDLSNTKVTDDDLRWLSDLKHLRFLHFSKAPVTNAGLKRLAGLQELHGLNLTATKVSDPGLKALAALNKLSDLNLSHTEVTGTGLADLAGLKKLQLLDLSVSKVTGDGLKSVAKLEQLGMISLAGTKVGDADLKQLAGLKQLHTLWLQDTPVTDAGLSELIAIRQLRSLALIHTQVTDKGLKELAKLKQLQGLDVRDTQVTDEGVAALTKALPKLRVTAGRVKLQLFPSKPSGASAQDRAWAIVEKGIQAQGGEAKGVSGDLHEIGLAYHMFLYINGDQAPKDIEDLKPYLGANPAAYSGLKDGRYIFIWNVRLADMSPDSEHILAYEKDVPTKGGVVLYGNNFKKTLTAEEFKAAKKAKPKN